RRPARAGPSPPRRTRSNEPQLLELADRFEERATADRVEERVADVGDLRGSRGAVAPAERPGIELERARPFAERVLLVAEHCGGEDVQEAVLACRRVRVVQSGSRLEDEAALTAAADELRKLLD